MTIPAFFRVLNNFRGLILLAGFIKWMAFHAWVVHDWFEMERTLSIWDSAVSNMLLVVLCLVLAGTLNGVPRAGKFWFALGFSMVLAAASLWLSYEILAGVGSADGQYMKFLYQSIPVRGGLNFVTIAGVSLSSIFYFQWEEQEEVSRREAATLAMVREAELQKLQQQLQPHFLFNCLNSVNAMIGIRPEEAKKMVLHLSEFLRTTMKRADDHWVSLEEEWNYLQLYLDIEKVRFGHRLEVVTAFETQSQAWIIPTLLLQPLVENAIKYGLYGTTEKVKIEVMGEIKDRFLQITVTNPFDPGAQPYRGSGFGISGLRRRLYLLYARNDLLEISAVDNKFTVLLKIPPRL